MLLVRANTSTRHTSPTGSFCRGGDRQREILEKIIEIDRSHAWLVDVAGHAETEGIDRDLRMSKCCSLSHTVLQFMVVSITICVREYVVSVKGVCGVEFAFQVLEEEIGFRVESRSDELVRRV